MPLDLSKPRLGLKVELFQVADVDQALLELGELRAARKIFETELRAEHSAATEKFARKCLWNVEGEKVPFDEREEQLLEAIATYTMAHRDELIAEGKSVRLDHGSLEFRNKPAHVEPIKGKTDKHVATWLKEQIVSRLMTAVRTFRLGLGQFTDQVVRVKVELNKQGILQAYKQNDITNQQLEKLFVRVVDGEEELLIEPAGHELKGHAAALEKVA